MKKRLLSMLLAFGLLTSVLPMNAVAKGAEFGFLNAVTYELPIVTEGEFIAGEVDLPTQSGTGFIGELSGDMPEIREDGFLAEPTAPLKTFPMSGTLMNEVGEPDPAATPITTAEELAAMKSGGNYYLTADIDLSGVDWKPISGKTYILDGQGHRINGLTPTADASQYYVGLFGKVENLTVRNLMIHNYTAATASHHRNLGVLAGYVSSGSGSLTVENCIMDHVTITVDGSWKNAKVSGMIGDVNIKGDASFRACGVSGDITYTQEAYALNQYSCSAYGMALSITAKTLVMEDCLSQIEIALPDGSGTGYGMTGTVKCETVELTRCVSSCDIHEGLSGMLGQVTATKAIDLTDCVFDGRVGNACAGMIQKSTAPIVNIENCRTEGALYDIKGRNSIIGGMIGYVSNPSSYVKSVLTVNNSLAAADISMIQIAADMVGGLIGCSDGGTFTDCLSTGNITVADAVTGTMTSGGLLGDGEGGALQMLRCENQGAMQGSISGGLVGHMGTSSASTVDFTDCKNSGAVTHTAKSAKIGGLLGLGNGDLTNCVNTGDLSGETVGGLVGSGDGAVIDCRVKAALTTNAIAGGLRGIVSKMDEYLIENCAVELDVHVEDGSYVGGLVGCGYGYTTVKNCNVDFSMDGNCELAGGLFGKVHGALNAMDCFADVKADTGDIFGGLLGSVTSKSMKANNCIAEVEIENAVRDVGGLLGQGNFQITQCYAVGQIASDADNSCIGGLVGYGDGTIGQCWTDVEIVSCGFAGGLGGAVNGTVYGSWASGDIVEADGMVSQNNRSAGGLVGSSREIAVQDCCYLGKLENNGRKTVGGLIGTGSGMIRNCYYEGDLASDGSELGGLIGSGKMNVYECWYAGTIEGQGSAGGMIGSGSGVVEDCIVRGSVYGNNVGGIAGAFDGEIDSCVSDVHVDGQLLVGGFVGELDGVITDCHYKRTMYSQKATALGGIAGKVTYSVLRNCSARDVSLNDNLGTESARYAGGLVGSVAGTSVMENCKVSGNVLLMARDISHDAMLREFYVGGLAGYTLSDLYAVQCVVNGAVRGYLTADHEDGRRNIYIGGLGGRANGLYVENSLFCGSVSFGSYAVHEHRLLGQGTVIDENINLDLPERKTENYQVKVISFDPQKGTTSLLKDAEIKVDGVSKGFTDERGLLSFDNKEILSTGLVTISADLEGYFHGETVTYLADGGVVTIALTEKVPGQLYIKSAHHLKGGCVTEVLTGYNKVRIPQIDTGYSELMIGVDWNDLDKENRVIRIVGENGKSVVYLDETGHGMACFSNMFEPEEEVYIVASGTYNGAVVSQTQKLYVNVSAIEASIPTPTGDQELGGTEIPGDKDSNALLYFLNGLNIKVSLGDLAALGPDITYKNGILKIKLSTDDIDDAKEKMQKISVFDKRTDKVEVSGEFAIPITDLYAGEWSGSMAASINGGHKAELSAEKIKEYNESASDQLKITYNFMVGPVPCYVDTSLSAGGEVELKVAGNWDDARVDGKLSVTGKAAFSGGVGGAVNENAELKIGPYGDLSATIPMTYTFQGDFDLDPSLKGGLGVKVSVKAYILKVEEKLKIGGFDWDKNGVVWSALWNQYDADGNLIIDSSDSDMGGRSLFLAEASDAWTMINRDYLENGGGFRTQNIDLLRFHNAAGGKLRYENISETSEAAMAVENGQLVLYFTADDGAANGGGLAEHTVLYRTSLQEDGNWSEPTALTHAADGYPALPNAENGFVAWVNSEQIDDLDAMLASTDIQVFDGSTVTTFEGNGYVSSPKLSVSADGTQAMLCWLSDPEVSGENLLGGDGSIYYSVYRDGVWSEPDKAVTNGVPVYAEPDCASNTVYYITEDGYLYRQGYTSAVTSGFSGRTDLYNSVSAAMNGLNQLIIRTGSTSWLCMDTSWNGSEAPVIAYDGVSDTYFVFWAETGGIRYVHGNKTNWSKPLLLTATNGAPTGIRASVVNGMPMVSYYETVVTAEGTRTDLYTAAADPEGIDFVLSELDYSRAERMNEGYVALQAKIYNNGLADADGVLVTITDENGNTVYSGIDSTAVQSGEVAWIYPVFAADGKTHTYTVNLRPIVNDIAVNDTDEADNTLCVEVGKPAAVVADTCFLSEDGTNVQLQALVRNTGGTELDPLTVEIGTSDGDVLLTKTFIGEENAIPSGAYRQIILEQVQPNVCYTVTVRMGDEVLDTDMLIYEDPNAQVLAVKNVQITQTGGASLTLVGQNLKFSGTELIFAVYQEGQMVACGMRAIEDFNGTQNIVIPLSETLEAGAYDYQVFFLSDAESLVPIWMPCRGELQVDP